MPGKDKAFDGAAFQIPLQFVNRGQTPAYKAAVWAKVAILPSVSPEPFVGRIITKDGRAAQSGQGINKADFKDMAKTVIGSAGGVLYVHANSSALTRAERAELGSGERRVYVYGAIYYVDAFRRYRRTRFQLSFGFSGEKMDTMEFDAQGNDAT